MAVAGLTVAAAAVGAAAVAMHPALLAVLAPLVLAGAVLAAGDGAVGRLRRRGPNGAGVSLIDGIAIDAIPDGEFVCDAAGRLLEVRPGPSPVFLAPTAPRLAHALPAQAAALIMRGVEEVLAGAPEVAVPYAFATGGSLRECEARLIPAGEGRVLGIVRDVTSGRREERAAQQSQRLESLGVLAGGVAHDFNNLLVSILGNAQVALAQLPPGAEEAREVINDIVAAGRRGADVTMQMLAYAGKATFSIEPVDLPRLVADTARHLQGTLPVNVALHWHSEGDFRGLQTDAARIRDILAGLAINAADAIGAAGGTVTMRAYVADANPLAFAEGLRSPGMAAGTFAVLEVADGGCGMDAETVTRVFDPFFTTKFTGRGLGLPAVLGLVRGLRGAVAVDSAPGKGSAFRVYLPLARPEPVALPAAPLSVSAGKTVLVVDDEENVRAVTARALGKAGYDVMTAGSAGLAADLLRQHVDEIALVLLDMMMPGQDGVEAYDQLVRISPGAPVVVVSGCDEQDARQQFGGRRLAGFIQKPYDLAVLSRTLGEALACSLHS